MSSLLSLYLILLISPISSYHINNYIIDSSWEFIGKFCYDYSNQIENNKLIIGIFDINISIYNNITNNNDIKVVIYENDGKNWSNIVNKFQSQKCYERIINSAYYINVTMVDNSFSYSMPVYNYDAPKYWFIYISTSNCNRINGTKSPHFILSLIDLIYDVHFQNLKLSSNSIELSYDKNGLPQIYLVLFLISIIMTAYMIYSIILLRQTGSFHPIVQIMFTVCILSSISSCLYMIHYFIFASDGFGLPYIHALAFLVDIGTKLTFFILAFLLSEGWTISSDSLPNKFYSALIILLIANANLFGFIFSYYLNEESSFYFYDSPPGIINTVLYICSAIIFGVSLNNSIERESSLDNPKITLNEEKINNLKFIWRILPWFIILPCLCILVLLIPIPYRYLTIIIISNLIELIFYMFICWSMHPIRISSLYKFSNRTKNIFEIAPTYDPVDEGVELL